MRKRVNSKKLISFVFVFLVFAAFFALAIEPTPLNIVLSGLVSYMVSNIIISVIAEKSFFSKVKTK